MWPPCEEEFLNIAANVFESDNHDINKQTTVLVYWDNPELMIFDPIHFARTDYIEKEYMHKEKGKVKIIIGKED